MFLKCSKCKKMVDPSRELMHCSAYGHTRVLPTEQNLSDALLQTQEKKPKNPGFQSDFRLIWNEPDKY